MKKYFTWNAPKFYTATELLDFIQPVRKYLIGKKLDKIMVMGALYSCVGLDEQERRCVKYSNENEWSIDDAETEILSTPTHQVALEFKTAKKL